MGSCKFSNQGVSSPKATDFFIYLLSKLVVPKSRPIQPPTRAGPARFPEFETVVIYLPQKNRLEILRITEKFPHPYFANISQNSPIAQALIGIRVGDKFKISTNGDQMEAKLLGSDYRNRRVELP